MDDEDQARSRSRWTSDLANYPDTLTVRASSPPNRTTQYGFQPPPEERATLPRVLWGSLCYYAILEKIALRTETVLPRATRLKNHFGTGVGQGRRIISGLCILGCKNLETPWLSIFSRGTPRLLLIPIYLSDFHADKAL